VTRGPLDEAALLCLALALFAAVYAGVCFALTGRLPQ